MSDLNMSTTITPDEAIKLLGLAIKPRVTKEIELSVAPDVTDKFLEAINMAIEALGKPEPHWIPCSERLPEVKQKCWFSIPMKVWRQNDVMMLGI